MMDDDQICLLPNWDDMVLLHHLLLQRNSMIRRTKYFTFYLKISKDLILLALLSSAVDVIKLFWGNLDFPLAETARIGNFRAN